MRQIDAVRVARARHGAQQCDARPCATYRPSLLRVALYGCDNTHGFTRDWAALHKRDPEDVIALAQRHGDMSCACEVVMNVRVGNVGSSSAAH